MDKLAPRSPKRNYITRWLQPVWQGDAVREARKSQHQMAGTQGKHEHAGATHDPAGALLPALPSAFDCLHRRLVTGLADTLGARLPAVAHLPWVVG